jgi:hypothetical protein
MNLRRGLRGNGLMQAREKDTSLGKHGKQQERRESLLRTPVCYLS